MTAPHTRDWTQGRDRLAAIARKADPDTRRHLDDLGLGDGWNCLEIGAGSGSLAHWIAQRVAPNGSVVATDLDVRMLQELKADNLEVRQHNVDEEPLKSGAYDLVVTRYLLEWLKDPKAVLAKIVDALAPSGWVLIESDDWGAMPPATAGAQEQLQRVRKACFEFLGTSTGYNPDIGRQLVSMLEAAGLQNVGATGRSVLLRGGTPEVQLYKYELEMAGSELVQAGRITSDDLAAVLKIYDDPSFCMMSPLTITAWGRRKS